MIVKLRSAQFTRLFLILLCQVVSPLASLAQSRDSIAEIMPFRPAIQVQLYNGVGVNYLGHLTASTRYRVGVDISIHYGESSGPGDVNVFTVNSYYTKRITSQKSETSSHYIGVSPLALFDIAAYSRAALYWGIGPSVSYQYTKTASTYNERTDYHSSGNSFYEANSSDDTSIRTVAFGSAALVGIRGNVVDGFGVTAEIECRAMYEITHSDGLRTTYEMTGSSTLPNVQEAHSSGKNTGWSLTLANVRAGIIFNL